jgi:hypothetical protein
LKTDEDNIREKLMRIKTQTVKRGFDDLTKNVNDFLGRVESYNGTKRRTRRPKLKKKIVNSVNFDLGNISNTEDLRNSKEVDLNEPVFNQPNTHLDEQERLESPNSPLKSETPQSNTNTIDRYQKAVSGMFDSINMSKLSRRKPRAKKPVGTSMNSRPRRKRTRTSA